ncbi:uncharacterized protein [Onthophagus taurus]|uniref:uncharacterized protein isoform X2 n=1 Tax=Onthophagus taurus TaxID=166361 RepID=UPI0039BEB308
MREIPNSNEYPILEEPPAIPKRQKTLRKDLSDNGPKEFRHIPRQDSKEFLLEEKRQFSSIQNVDQNIIDNIQHYFSGVDSNNLKPLKLPRIAITRSLTKKDISYPANFLHIAHVDYHQVSRQLEEMSDFPGRNSSNSEFDFAPKENLSRDDISEPTAFRHLAHIGLENNQLRMETEDKTMRIALDKAGTSEKQQNIDSRRNLAEILQNTKMKNKENEVENSQKKVITKEDIGLPENFQHLAHVDLNSSLNIEEAIEKSCQKNIDRKDKEIQNFILDIMDDEPSNVTVNPPLRNLKKPIPAPRKFKKTDIENPQHFRHNAHVSYNKEKPIHDVVLQNFFKKAGVTEEHLNDQETREFIFDFIRQYSKVDDDRNHQTKPIPSTYTSLAKNLQDEVEELFPF